MATAFVAGGSGFIGERFVRSLVEGGHTVFVLTRSPRRAARIRQAGAELVFGDLLTPGPWLDVARSASWIVHLAQPQTFGGRITHKRAESYRADRARMDRVLLDALDPAVVERIVYVAGTSYYGDLGLELRDEAATPRPRGWGPYIAPAIEALAADLARGLPIVTAFPGYVYGDGSWFREYVLSPLSRGKKINAVGGRSRFGSPIHVDDCARALLHLLVHGAIGARYFLVDDRPVQWMHLYERTASAMGQSARLRFVPTWLLRLLVGSVVTDSVLSDAVLSNARLTALGFRLAFPTIDEGIPDVVAKMRPIKR